MKTIWTSHLKGEDKDRFQNSVLGSRQVLERLEEIVTELEKENNATERSVSAYSNPSWAYLQAHKNGYASALSQIKSIVNLDQG